MKSEVTFGGVGLAHSDSTETWLWVSTQALYPLDNVSYIVYEQDQTNDIHLGALSTHTRLTALCEGLPR